MGGSQWNFVICVISLQSLRKPIDVPLEILGANDKIVAKIEGIFFHGNRATWKNAGKSQIPRLRD
jgi:hypothetical protein